MPTYIANGQSVTYASTRDNTVNIGSAVKGRKALSFLGWKGGGVSFTSSKYDPTGANSDLTLIVQVNPENPSEDTYHLRIMYFDIPAADSGSKVFRCVLSTNTYCCMGTIVLGQAKLGAVEAYETFSLVDPSTAISDSITTLTNDAMIVGYAWGIANAASKYINNDWDPDNGQTEVFDTQLNGNISHVGAYLAKAVAGAQTIGWSGAPNTTPDQVKVMGLVSVATGLAQVTLAGDITQSTREGAIVAGGKQITLTLANDTWVP